MATGESHGLAFSSMVSSASMSLPHASITVSVPGCSLHEARLTGFVTRGTGKVASAVVHLLSSGQDNKNRRRYSARRSHIARCCSDENVENEASLEEVSLSSLRAAATPPGLARKQRWQERVLVLQTPMRCLKAFQMCSQSNML